MYNVNINILNVIHDKQKHWLLNKENKRNMNKQRQNIVVLLIFTYISWGKIVILYRDFG